MKKRLDGSKYELPQRFRMHQQAHDDAVRMHQQAHEDAVRMQNQAVQQQQQMMQPPMEPQLMPGMGF